MTAKKKTGFSAFVCSQCGYTQPRWLGRCPECGEWNTFQETITNGSSLPDQISSPKPLSSVDPMEGSRLSTGIEEFDRVLGGGAMRRSAILIGGEPGIGKSTLLLQTAAAIKTGGRTLYVSGEESAGQIRMRADRLNLRADNVEVLCAVRLEDIETALENAHPVCVIVDSIQTINSEEAGVVPGTVNQLKYCAHELVSWVKSRDCVLFLTAHVTKDGMIAGPKALEHLVDTVVSFEKNEEDVRFLRALKNRFGSVDELGLFNMTDRGLQALADPSSLFIVRRRGALPPGIAVTPVFEGSRIFMIELQALTVPAKGSLSRVFSDKIDSARVSRIAAVLEKRTGVRFSDQDVYINVAGGVRLTEPALDAALAAALYSARVGLPVPEHTALTGELSLAGEARPVNRLKQRAKTAAGMGFSTLIAPDDEEHCTKISGITDMLDLLFGASK